MAEIDKKDIIIELLKNENDGLYLAYGEIGKRLRLEENENKKLKEKILNSIKQYQESIK